MGFPIDLPSGKGMTINYMLCIIALSCFFSGTSGYGGGGWSTLRLFAFAGWQGSKPPQERGWQCAVERWQKTTQKV